MAGSALNGAQAIELVHKLHPDVVTLDLDMPGMNGIEALENIMYDCPTPVVVVSGVSSHAAETVLHALDLGAVDYVFKYSPGVDTDTEALQREIIAKVRAAARIHVIRSVRQRRPSHEIEPTQAPEVLPAPPRLREGWSLAPGGLVVIGASTGGPVALRELLSNLPAEFPAALMIVQHIPATFTRVLAAQLSRHCSLEVTEARTGDRLSAGHVLVAPGGYHLLVRPDSKVELNLGPEIGGHRPSIDVTMQSAAQLYGARTQGVVLTGMGGDGALGLQAIRNKGGKTYAQDAESCVVNGMPQSAIDKGVVDYIAPPGQIAHLLKLSIAHLRDQ